MYWRFDLDAHSDWVALGALYSHLIASERESGVRRYKAISEEFGLSRQAAHYRVQALERDALRVAFVAARSAALRALFLKELLSYVDEPWFETYAGFPLNTPDAVVEQVIREVRSAYP